MPGYLVPKERCRVETRYGNSRFLATVDRAGTVKDAQDFIRAIRAEMPDATHHVYAYRIGHGSSIREGLSDDGEPAGTSGPPAMAVLRGSDVGDVALVITRYFGGTKLGTGGLVAAYTEAAQAAFAALVTEEKIERRPFHLGVPYALLETVRQILAEEAALVTGETFGAEIALGVLIPVENLDGVSRRLSDCSGGGIVPREDEASDTGV